jgi:hypothetical protein
MIEGAASWRWMFCLPIVPSAAEANDSSVMIRLSHPSFTLTAVLLVIAAGSWLRAEPLADKDADSCRVGTPGQWLRITPAAPGFRPQNSTAIWPRAVSTREEQDVRATPPSAGSQVLVR